MDPNLENFYHAALHAVSASFGPEREWQKRILDQSFSEDQFLREAAWVILCSGFRESVVRRRFDAISLCFCDWVSADHIVNCGERCTSTAMTVFGNARKITAILRVCCYVHEHGFDSLSSRIREDPLRELQRLPFIGPVTSYHLAKNLGIDVAKPDRHLMRLASEFGFPTVGALCATVSRQVGEPASVVDIVLWRYCAIASSMPTSYRESWLKANLTSAVHSR